MEGYSMDKKESSKHEATDSNSSNSPNYLKELIAERNSITPKMFNCTVNLLDNEIENLKKNVMKIPLIDLYRCVPIQLTVKVSLPNKEYPKTNFVGILLGHKGNKMKKMMDETSCWFTIQGKGSMKDKELEERLLESTESRYAHLKEDLHIEIQTVAEAPEAFARIGFAILVIKSNILAELI